MHIYAKVKINILRTMRCESQTQQLCGLAYNTAHAQLLTFTAMRLTTYSPLSTIEALRQLLQPSLTKWLCRCTKNIRYGVDNNICDNIRYFIVASIFYHVHS